MRIGGLFHVKQSAEKGRRLTFDAACGKLEKERKGAAECASRVCGSGISEAIISCC